MSTKQKPKLPQTKISHTLISQSVTTNTTSSLTRPTLQQGHAMRDHGHMVQQHDKPVDSQARRIAYMEDRFKQKSVMTTTNFISEPQMQSAFDATVSKIPPGLQKGAVKTSGLDIQFEGAIRSSHTPFLIHGQTSDVPLILKQGQTLTFYPKPQYGQGSTHLLFENKTIQNNKNICSSFK